MPNKIEVRIGGSGGQGVVLAGQILGKAAVIDGKNVLQTQTYGAEARGSLARSEVIISDDRIGFPAVRECDILVVMNQESLDKHLQHLKQNGVLIADKNIEKIPELQTKVFKVPATETAKRKYGNSIYANMIVLGALTETTKIVSIDAMEKTIRESVPEKTVETNINAFRIGVELVK